MTIEFILTLAGSFVAIIVSISGLFAGIGYYKQGKNEAKSSDVDSANSTVRLYKDRADAFEKDLKELHREIDALKKDFTFREESYKKTIDQQEQLIKTYAAILQNRNPELENTLKSINDFLKEIRDSGLHNSKILDTQAKRQISDDNK